jgi:hypothetical protein
MRDLDVLMVKGVVGTEPHPLSPYALVVHVSPLYWLSKERMARLRDTLDHRMHCGVIVDLKRSWRLW